MFYVIVTYYKIKTPAHLLTALVDSYIQISLLCTSIGLHCLRILPILQTSWYKPASNLRFMLNLCIPIEVPSTLPTDTLSEFKLPHLEWTTSNPHLYDIALVSPHFTYHTLKQSKKLLLYKPHSKYYGSRYTENMLLSLSLFDMPWSTSNFF